MRVKKAKVRLYPPEQLTADRQQYRCGKEGRQGGRESGRLQYAS